MKYIVALLFAGDPALITPIENPVTAEGIENDAAPEVLDPEIVTGEPAIGAPP
jgi:hypothetical protein